MKMHGVIIACAFGLAACAVAKPDAFVPIGGVAVPPAERDAAYAFCLPQAKLAGEQAAIIQQSMQGGMVAVGRPAFVAGAAIGHAIGSAISIAAARARGRDLALEACMAQRGFAEVPK
jgi:hypothetical protein